MKNNDKHASSFIDVKNCAINSEVPFREFKYSVHPYAGFSLIELMIVVAIIGIIAAIAYPSYTQYILRTHRTDVQADMIGIAQKLGSSQLANGKYPVNATIVSLYGSTTSPKQGTPLYTLGFTSLTASNWVLTATPTGPQTGNGIVCLDSQGQKFWAKGATACVLSATSTWDGR